MDGRSILALGIGAVAALLVVVGALLRQRALVSGVVIPAAALVGALYVDETIFDWVAIGVAMLLATFSKRVIVVAVVGLGAYAVAELVPSGWNAAVHVLIAIICISVFRSSLRHLARLRRARALQPGDAPAHDVALSGRVEGPIVPPPPGTPLRAAWWFIEHAPRWASSGQLRLRSDAGTVLVEPDDAAMRLARRQRIIETTSEALDALLPAHADEDAAEDADGGRVYSLHWLEPDDEVYVVGKPEWGRGPADMAGYRDAPLVPLFRSGGTLLRDGSAAEARRHAVFQLIAWSLWTAAVIAVTTAHLTAWI